MKPLAQLLLCIFLSAHLPAQTESGIHFETDSFSVLLAKAKHDHKIVFIDCYTTWCGPCKWMDANVYPNDTVGKFYNSSFVCTRIDMEHGEGIELAKKYEVKCYPTYLFIDNNGNLVHRKSSAQTTQMFISMGNDALSPDLRFSAFVKEYDRGTMSSADLVTYLKLRQSTCLSTDDELKRYFTTDTSHLLSNPATWILLRDFQIAPHSVAFEYLHSHLDYYSGKHTADSVYSILERSYAGALYASIYDEAGTDTGQYHALKREVAGSGFPFGTRLCLATDMAYYQRLGDWKNFGPTACTYISGYMSTNAIMLNNCAWEFYDHIDDTTLVDTAIAWARRSIAITRESYNTDTYAHLLYKRGRIAEAEKAANESIELAKAEHADYSETEELIKLIHKTKNESK